MAQTPEQRRANAKRTRQRYIDNKEQILAAAKAAYAADPNPRKKREAAAYKANSEPKKKRARATYAADPERARKQQRINRLWVLFRLLPEEWEVVLKHQGGVCAITGKPAVKNALSTDHDHKTGKFRGLLSVRINRALAYFNDDPIILRKAAEYLENPPAVAALGREVYGLIGKAKHKKTMIYGSPNGPIKPAKKGKP